MRLLLALAIVMLSGCATQRILVHSGAVQLGPTSVQTRPANLTLDAASICGEASKVDQIEIHEDILHGIIGWLTLGLMEFREYRVYCRRE